MKVLLLFLFSFQAWATSPMPPERVKVRHLCSNADRIIEQMRNEGKFDVSLDREAFDLVAQVCTHGMLEEQVVAIKEECNKLYGDIPGTAMINVITGCVVQKAKIGLKLLDQGRYCGTMKDDGAQIYVGDKVFFDYETINGDAFSKNKIGDCVCAEGITKVLPDDIRRLEEVSKVTSCGN